MRSKNLVIFFLITCLILVSNHVSAQDEKLISVDLTDVSFTKFVQTIENAIPCRFYYNPAETDSLRVTIKVDKETLTLILQQALKGTVFQFSIDQQSRIFITQKYKIQTALPEGFFDHTNAVKTTVTEPMFFVKNTDPEKDKLKASIERKLIEIGSKLNIPGKGNGIVSGYVRDMKSGEAISGAVVYVDTPAIKAITDQFGYYSITLPRGRHTIHISSVGMKDTKRQLSVNADGKLTIEMEDYIASLKAVTVVTEKRSNIRSTQMGVERVNVRTIKQVPSVLGESDILRVVLTLPGVTSVGEASTGFNVRGGAADQNLILLNDATIYNPSHLFGFFSAFNTDVVKGVELYKSAIPEKYGGRLSSVLDVSTRDGNSKKLSATGGIGILTSRLTLEGPLDSNKTTFILGGRTTYSDWILQQIPNSAYANSSASFYDLNLNITHTINPKNTLYLTGYMSHDRFRLDSDTLYKYGNRNAIIKWKHLFNNRLFSVVSAGADRYDYSVSSDKYPVNAYKLSYDVNQTHFRTEFNYNPNNKHSLNFGVHTILYKIHPGTNEPAAAQSLVVADKVPTEQALEAALYLGDRYNITPNLSVNAGLRYSLFSYLGPHDVYTYLTGSPRTTGSITGITSYASGKNIKTYSGPEIRLAMRYSISKDASVKLSYNTLRQYIHTLSNSTAISPTDIWKLSDSNIPPQQGLSGIIGNFIRIFQKVLKHPLKYIINTWIITLIIKAVHRW